MAAPEDGADRVRFEVEGCGHGMCAEGQAIAATRALDPSLADGLTAETQDLHYGQVLLVVRAATGITGPEGTPYAGFGGFLVSPAAERERHGETGAPHKQDSADFS